MRVRVRRGHGSAASVYVGRRMIGALHQTASVGPGEKIIYSVSPSSGKAINRIIPGGVKSMTDAQVVALVLEGLEYTVYVRDEDIKAWTKWNKTDRENIKLLKGG